MIIPQTKHVLRKVESFEENAVQADFLQNDVPMNKFVVMPK